MLSKTIFLALVILTLASAAPSDSEKKVDKAVATSADERDVVAADQFWTFLSGSTGGILTGVLGAVFLIGGLGLGVYYFYYLTYYGDNVGVGYSGATSGQVGGATGIYSNPAYYSGGTYPQYYTSAVARSLDTGNGAWDWPQVLFMISLAQETYEKFDFQSLECQKKALCELSQKQNDFGETGRKISTTFSSAARRFLGIVEGLPMPTLILTYLKEYREAINQGRSSKKECATIYPTCNFSMKEIIVKYEKRAAGEKL